MAPPKVMSLRRPDVCVQCGAALEAGTRADGVREEFAIDVMAALCFVDAEWSLFAKPFTLEGVWIGWAKALGERLLVDGPLSPDHLMSIACRVGERLPAA